ncbi:MAG: hypothetical protein KC496_03110 [Anaerolineae bacterium]|nr:hypothetical protein [Anaerolineae bacterium]
MVNGVIYVATGDKYIEEALYSAASLKRYMPHLPVTLFTDRDVESPYLDQLVLVDEAHSAKRAKIHYMSQSPYERTLFLDTDTYICGDLTDTFDMLDHFDLAAVHENGQETYPVEQVPTSFPEYNSGVILFQNTERVRAFFQQWQTIFDSETWIVKGRHFDQPSFRQALYESDLRIATLTSQYNCHFVDGGCVAGEIKILHRRSNFDFPVVEKVLNQTIRPRIYIADRAYVTNKIGGLVPRVEAQQLGVFGKAPQQLVVERWQKYLEREGLRGTLHRAWKRLRGKV